LGAKICSYMWVIVLNYWGLCLMCKPIGYCIIKLCTLFKKNIWIENLINWLDPFDPFCPVNSTTINKEEICWYTTISSWHNQFKQTKILCTLYLLNFHNMNLSGKSPSEKCSVM
jgi:hypothetical protein